MIRALVPGVLRNRNTGEKDNQEMNFRRETYAPSRFYTET